MRWKLAMGIIVLLLLLVATQSQFIPDKPKEWYAVEPWEIQVCQKWGGRESTDQLQTVEEGLTGFGPFTYTMLAKKRKDPATNETLYTYAYYAEAYSVNLAYSFDLYNPETQRRRPLLDGVISAGDSVRDYGAEYIDEEFTQIRIIHQFGKASMPIRVIE